MINVSKYHGIELCQLVVESYLVISSSMWKSAGNTGIHGFRIKLQTDFLLYFHFYACFLRKMEYNDVRGG